ncbi:hypothetical protein, partial [Actinomadura rubrisoli]|uniref:hypothetical protein n=1 Tax=Actinomadura rubrisoli TaxID=2530368 RepID=UPI0014053DAA
RQTPAAALPRPSAILSHQDLWLPTVTLPAGPQPRPDWAGERTAAHAAAHAEFRRALDGFLLDGDLQVLDDPAALVERPDASMIPAWDLGFALHHYAAELHWTCAYLAKDQPSPER